MLRLEPIRPAFDGDKLKEALDTLYTAVVDKHARVSIIIGRIQVGK